MTCVGRIKCCLEATTRHGIQGIAVRVLEIVEPVELEQEDYDGWVPPPTAGELLRKGGGDVAIHVLRESNATASALRALMSTASAEGYVMRGHSSPILGRAQHGPIPRTPRNHHRRRVQPHHIRLKTPPRKPNTTCTLPPRSTPFRSISHRIAPHRIVSFGSVSFRFVSFRFSRIALSSPPT
jgi:hypothetical protein